MTEEQWLACTDPTPMLQVLGTCEKATDRKLRLFAVACCSRLLRVVQVDFRDVHAVSIAERYADGQSTAAELKATQRYVPGPPSARRTAAFACRDATSLDDAILMADCTAENAAWAIGEQAVRSVNANTFNVEFNAARGAEKAAQAAVLRDIVGNPFRPLPPLEVSWHEDIVRGLATQIYEECDFSRERMAALGAAFSDAGCRDTSILEHCGIPNHVKGCFLVDMLLGKE